MIENYANDHDANQYSLGWNTMWDGHNGWRAMAISAGRGPTAPSILRNDGRLRSSAAVARRPTVFVRLDRPWYRTFTTSDVAIIPTRTCRPDRRRGLGRSIARSRPATTSSARSKDDLKEARGEIEREIGGFVKSIKIGRDYTDHNKTCDAG